MKRLTLLLVVVAGLLIPASAEAKVVKSFCSPSGDFCQYIMRKDNRIKFEMRQFPLQGKYRLCVKPPRRGYICKTFRWRKSGPIFKSVVDFNRQFPSGRRGRYKVQWRTSDGYKLGKTLSFKKV